MFDFSKLKKVFLYTLIGSLIVSALVAVVTVLVGDFNKVTARVLFTLVMVIVHSLLSLGFSWNIQRKQLLRRFNLFSNTIFFLLVLSFLTSIFGIWKIISPSVVADVYQTYFIVAFAALHADVLTKALKKQRYLDYIIQANYIFMAVVIALLQIFIYGDPGELLMRILAACGIIDGTLTLLVIIFYRLYIAKHPQARVEGDSHGLGFLVWLLIIFLVVQVVVPVLFLLITLL